MSAQFINPILQSTLDVLSTMAMTQPTAGKPVLKKDNLAQGDVTGLINFSGEKNNGSLAISFSKDAIFDISEKMLGEKIDSLDDSVVDLVGELTNMITGGAKRIYSEQGMEFDLTLPKTVTGKDQTIEHSVSGPVISLPFSTEAGLFYIEFCFQ